MSAPARNLVNLHAVDKSYGPRAVLRGVPLGLLAGTEHPDAGTVTRTGGVETALLGQGDELVSSRTIREQLVGARADHEWAGDSAFRTVLDGLLGGVGMARFPDGL